MFMLIFSPVHINTAHRMVNDIGLSKFEKLEIPEKILEFQKLPPSFVKSNVKEKVPQNINLKKGSQSMFNFPFPVSKIALNRAAEGKSVYFTEFSFANLSDNEADAYKRIKGDRYTQCSSDSTISRISASIDDYHSLSGSAWLTDTPVDLYMLWLTRNYCQDTNDAYFMPSLMYQMIEIESIGPDKVVSYLKEKNIDLLAYNVYVPVCQDSHWTLMVMVNVHKVDKRLEQRKKRAERNRENPFPCFLYFNSLGGEAPGKPIRLTLLKLLRAWRKDLSISHGINPEREFYCNPFDDPANHNIIPLCTIKGKYSLHSHTLKYALYPQTMIYIKYTCLRLILLVIFPLLVNITINYFQYLNRRMETIVESLFVSSHMLYTNMLGTITITNSLKKTWV